MMKSIVFCALLSVALAAPIDDAQAKIVHYDNNNDGLGNYEFSFETSNGIQRIESGKLINAGQPDEHIEVQGVSIQTDSKGELVFVFYTADQNGYRIIPIQSLQPGVPFSGPPHVVATLLG